MNLQLMPRTRTHDVSGFGVFAYGDAGEAHVMAHRMLDDGRHELGHRLLGAWLEGHTGSGSDWTHLQWHMAVFEIGVGRCKAALARFEKQILPVAALTDDALTDAPAILWRLQLEGRRAPADARDRLLTQMGIGLRAFAEGGFELAAGVLSAAAPKVSTLGGSHAQNQLFTSIAKHSWTQAQPPTQAAA